MTTGGTTGAVTDFDLMHRRLVGHQLPGSTMRVHHYEAVIGADAITAAADACAGASSELHPFWLLVAGLREWGVTLEEMFALAGATAADGPMLGEVGFEQLRALQPEHDYAVRAFIADAVRRTGKRAGIFDLVTVRVEIADADGELGSCSMTFVFPRRGQ